MTSLSMITHAAPSPSASSWRIGDLGISFGDHGRSHPPQQGAVLLIPSTHALTLHDATLQRILRPPLDLLYLPCGAQPYQTSAFHGWRLSLNCERLTQAASELSGYRLSPARFRRRLQSVRPLQARISPQRDLCDALLQLLQLSGSSPLQQHQQLELVGLDVTIQRVITLLLCGDLIASARQRGSQDKGSKSLIFDQLLAWIRNNLHRSIQLQDLVEQSGYSERSLRNFFHERFGCGPVQWIRGLRLEAARERLLNPDPQDTVSSIAVDLGYCHLSQFSRDFQSAYRMRPSELLREGHRGIVAD